MSTTTGKGYQYPAETDTVTSYPAIDQANAVLLDARPGVSVVNTTQMNAYTGTDLWDGRIVWNSTVNALMKYDLATTTWVNAVSITPSSTVAALIFGGSGAAGTLAAYSRGDHVHAVPSLAAYALLASPTFTGAPLVPTATPLTNNTQASSTGYTDAAVAVEKGRAMGQEGSLSSAITSLAGSTIPRNNINAVLTSAIENVNILTGAIPATLNVYVSTVSTLVYAPTACTANFIVNVASTTGTPLNSLLGIGQSITLEIDATMGGSPFICTAIEVDGVSQSIQWQGGTAPSAGFASAINVYTIKITKTAANSYFVLASMTQFG